MKKWLALLLAVAVGLTAACAAAAWYVQPAEQLDLSYREVAISGKIMEMIRSRRLQVELSEQELNDMAKKQLSQRTQLPHELTVEGARFALNGDRLTADVNVRWRGRLRVGATLDFQLVWNRPYLEIVHTGTQIRRSSLPAEWFQMEPLRISLDDYLPPIIGVKSVDFREHALVVDLKVE